MGNQNEDYLDQLLNSVGGQEKKAPEEQESVKAEAKHKIPRKLFRGKDTPEESFLEAYDREMLQLDAEQLIMDYEESLGEELEGKRTIFGKNGIFGKKKKVETAPVQEPVVFVPTEEPQVQPEENVVKKAPVKREHADVELDELFAGLAEVMEGKLPTEDKAQVTEETIDVVAEEPVEAETEEPKTLSQEDEDIFNAFVANSEDKALSEPQTEMGGGFEFDNLFGEPAEETSDMSDVMELLGGMTDDPDLAEIGQMLQAQDDKVDITFDDMENGVTEEQALTIIRNKDEEQPVDSEKSKRRAKWKFNKWNLEQKGFLHKLSTLLFGEDEEETPIHIHATSGIEDTTAENDEIIKKMEKEAALAEKKAKQQERKKAKEKKQEDAKKAKAAQKKVKDSERKAKTAEKKAKAAKEVDKTPPLPKKPVFLIFLLAASIIGVVLFAGHGVNYRHSMSLAAEAYSEGEYVEAYGHLRTLKIKEEDNDFIRKVSVLACMQELLQSYTTLYEAEEHEMALDNLIRVLGRYEDNMEEAIQLDIVGQISQFEYEAEELLKDVYGITYEEAMELYSMSSRKKYSVELIQILREVGLIQ